jgi:hypothetical protein
MANENEFTVHTFLQALREGSFTSLGSYPLAFLLSDGATMCPACAKKNCGRIARAIRDNERNGWRAVAIFIHYEGPPEDCCECNEMIDSAYGDPEAEAEDLPLGAGALSMLPSARPCEPGANLQAATGRACTLQAGAYTRTDHKCR